MPPAMRPVLGMMAPKIDDGLLDVVVVDDIGRLDLMLNFPKVYRGKHLEHTSFTLYQSRTVRITFSGFP